MKKTTKLIALTLGITTMFAASVLAAPKIQEFKANPHSAEKVEDQADPEDLDTSEIEEQLVDFWVDAEDLINEVTQLEAAEEDQARIQQYLDLSARIDTLSGKIQAFKNKLEQNFEDGVLAEEDYDEYVIRLEAIEEDLEQAKLDLREKTVREGDVIEAAAQEDGEKDPAIANVAGQTIAFENRVRMLVREGEKLQAMQGQKGRDHQWETLREKITRLDKEIEAVETRLSDAFTSGTLSQEDHASKSVALQALREDLEELSEDIPVQAE
jgi:oligoendopeptidase F